MNLACDPTFQLGVKATLVMRGHRLWRFDPVAAEAGLTSPGVSRRSGQKIAHSHQVVGRHCEAEHPIDSRDPAMARLTQPTHGFEPAKDLFHPFALALADRVARIAGGALVNDAALLACEMRSYSMLAHCLNQFFAVVAFVGAQRDPMPARNLLHHRQRRLRFGTPGSLGYAAVDRQPVAIFQASKSYFWGFANRSESDVKLMSWIGTSVRIPKRSISGRTWFITGNTRSCYNPIGSGANRALRNFGRPLR